MVRSSSALGLIQHHFEGHLRREEIEKGLISSARSREDRGTEGKRGRRGAHLDGINVEVTEAEAPGRVVDDCLIRLLVVFVLVVVEVGSLREQPGLRDEKREKEVSSRERESRRRRREGWEQTDLSTLSCSVDLDVGASRDKESR